MNSDSKLNIIDFTIMLMLTVSADAADILAILGIAIPVIGPALPVISWFYGLIISGVIIFWLIMKGVGFKWFLGGSGLELIPILNGLPARTIALVATFAENKLPLPELAKKTLSKKPI
ncbi:MAG: hypothetical protein HYY86_01530 [Candidatus Harrisonbacteria bacterium]|nr:hypothetical protein [Candidatus Harrisonbacteria bacterium]